MCATMTKLFQRQPRSSSTCASTRTGFSQNRATRKSALPGIGSAGSIQPYSVSALSGVIPSSATSSGRLPTAENAAATWPMNTESSET